MAECVKTVLATEAAWRTRANGHPLPSLFRKRRTKSSALKDACSTRFPWNAVTASPSRLLVLSATSTLLSPLMTHRSVRLPEGSLITENYPACCIAASMVRLPGTTPAARPMSPMSCPEKLKTHPEALRLELARDAVSLCQNENSGDLILLGWNWDGKSRSFAPERGAHAGPGPDETQGFLLVPPATRLPVGASRFVRPSGLRDAALALLGRKRLEMPHVIPSSPPSRLRIMSYNVHSCIGMDGRVSPRRIARVIAQQIYPIWSRSRLNHGRLRSRGKIRPQPLQEQLGYNVTFLRLRAVRSAMVMRC